MARRNRPDETFLPFNFSSILPFDSLAAALSELPTPRVQEPRTSDAVFLNTDLDCHSPDDRMEQQLSALLLQTAQDSDWDLDCGDNPRAALSCLSAPGSSPWEARVYDRLLTDFNHTRRRPQSLSSTPPAPARKTPKRPRHSPAQPPAPSAPRAFHSHRPSPLNLAMRTDSRLHARNSASKVHAFDTPPPPASVPHPTRHVAHPAPSRDTHLREMRLQRESEVVETDEFRYFTDFLKAFLRKADALAVRLNNRRDANLQVTSNLSYLNELRENIVLHVEQGAIAKMDHSLIARTLTVLDSRIWESCKQCPLALESPRAYAHTTSAIQLGFVASSIALSVMCAPDAPRALFVEERLEKIASLLEEVSTTILYPSADPLYRTLKSRDGRKSSSKGAARRDRQDNTDDLNLSRKFSVFSGKAGQILLDSCCSLYDRITALFIQESNLPESFTSRCARSCIDSFSISGIARLHVHSMRTLCAIFSSDSDQARRLWILDTVVCDVAAKMPPDRRQLRRFKAQGAKREIRVSSAVIAELLCLTCSENAEPSPSQEMNDPEKDDQSSSWPSVRRREYDRAAQFSVRVWESFFKRSLEKEFETRSAFHVLLEDTLLLYGRPEWPSTELMLQTLSVSLISRMRAEKEKSALLRAFSIEVLGILATKMCELYGDDVIQIVPEENLLTDNDSREEEREQILLFLDPSRSLLFQAAKSFYESLFAVDDIAMAKSKREDSTQGFRRNGFNSESDSEQETAVPTTTEYSIEEVEANAHARLRNVDRRRARREEICEQDAVGAAKCIGIKRSFAKGFRTLLDALLDGMQDHAPSVRAKSIRALSLVDEACHGILRVLPDIIIPIEASCKDVSTLARDAALDLLSRTLLRNGRSSYGIETNRTGDLDLSVMRQSTPQRVFGIVKERLRDTSTSVRKRAVSIMKSVLADALEQSEGTLSGQAKSVDVSEGTRRIEHRIVEICICLVPRLDDSEASVREASERTLRLGLFGFDSSQERRAKSAPAAQAIAQVVERLQAVLSGFPIKSHHSIMSRVFQDEILACHRQFVVAIVNASVNRLRDYEDMLADLPQGRRPAELSELELKQIKVMSAKKQACCSVLRAFSELDSSLLRSHCQPLAPIIKGMLDGVISHSDLACVECVLRILELAVGAHGDWDVDFLEELMRDVEHIVCTSPVQSIEEAAVRCLCVVTRRSASSEAAESLERVAGNFMGFLTAEKDVIEDSARAAVMASNNFEQKDCSQPGDLPRLSPLEKNARCAVVRLGLMIRFGDFPDTFLSEAYEAIELMCNALCTSFPSHALARSSIRALTHVLIRNRNLLAKGTKVLVSALESSNLNSAARKANSSSEYGLALCVLEGFRELLRDEEERNSKGKVTQKKEKNSLEQSNGEKEKHRTSASPRGEAVPVKEDEHPQLAAEEDAEAGYLALAAQAMISRLEAAVHSTARPVRQVVAHILGLLVRQGLVLPATVIPSLFCLLLDYDSSCREFSYRVISFLADRHSDMLASAALPGLRRCFQSSFAVRYGHVPLARDSKGADAFSYQVTEILEMSIDGKSGQSLLSQAIMAMRRDKRRGVLESLIREFDPRISIRKKTSERFDRSVMEAHQENGTDNASRHDVKGATQMDTELDDKENDEIPIHGGDLQIMTPGKLCSVPTLYFFAATLANIDYTDGAGVGGSLTQGGGTAAADSKLKNAKEDVSHLVGIATRIISNSGQATLYAARHILQLESHNYEVSPEKKDVVLESVRRISLLLLLKKHIKVTRYMTVLDTTETDISFQTQCRMPSFHPEGAMHQVFVDATNVGQYGNEQMDKMINLFRTLMREDAIDEADVTLSRMGRGARGSGKRASAKRVRRLNGGQANGEPRRERSGRQAAQNAAKKLRINSDESE